MKMNRAVVLTIFLIHRRSASESAKTLEECLRTGLAELGAKTTLGVPNKTGEEASEDKGEEVRHGEESSGLDSWKPEAEWTKFSNVRG